MGSSPSDQKIDQHYMEKNETMEILLTHRNIAPAFARTVWEKLEQDNPDFFRVYDSRQLVKDQIMEFNRLLAKQAQMMSKHPNNGIDSGHSSQGSHVSTRRILTPNGAQSSGQQLTVIRNNGSSLEPHSQENGVGQNMSLLAQQRIKEQFSRRAMRGYVGGGSSFNSSSRHRW